MAVEAHTPHHGRAWLCSLSAILLHAAVGMALPQGPSEEVQAAMAPAWISLAPAPAPAKPAPSPGIKETGGVASDKVAATPSTAAAHRPRRARRQRAQRHARALRDAATVSNAPAARTAPSDAAEARVASSGIAPTATPTKATTGGQPGSALTGNAGGSQGPAGTNAGGEGLHHAVLESGASCAGFFPASADATEGRVRVRVHVAPNGDPETCQVVTESPVGQGFGRAALACAHRLHFVPALDAHGQAIDDDATLELGFRRL